MADMVMRAEECVEMKYRDIESAEGRRGTRAFTGRNWTIEGRGMGCVRSSQKKSSQWSFENFSKLRRFGEFAASALWSRNGEVGPGFSKEVKSSFKLGEGVNEIGVGSGPEHNNVQKRTW